MTDTEIRRRFAAGEPIALLGYKHARGSTPPFDIPDGVAYVHTIIDTQKATPPPKPRRKRGGRASE